MIDEGCATRTLCVVDVTLTEVAWLAAAGRIELGGETSEFLTTALTARTIQVLPVTAQVADLASRIALHKDPADRLITATALVHGAKLVTSDRRLLDHPGLATVW